jgi:hypothetical protein
MFTATLRNNERGADHRQYRCSIVVRIRFRFRGNVFREPLPNNELFRLSGVILQYMYNYSFCGYAIAQMVIFPGLSSAACLKA